MSKNIPKCWTNRLKCVHSAAGNNNKIVGLLLRKSPLSWSRQPKSYLKVIQVKINIKSSQSWPYVQRIKDNNASRPYRKFLSVTGDVRINSNRDRQTSYAIMALKAGAAKYSVAYTFSPKESTVVKGLVTSNCTEELREANDSRSGKPYQKKTKSVKIKLDSPPPIQVMAKRKGVFLSGMASLMRLFSVYLTHVLLIWL